jgi:hypothetical protein
MAITLNSKVYNFIGFDKNGVSVYQETSAGVPTGFSYLTCKVTQSSGTADAVVRWRLTMPIVAAADSACSCTGSILRTYKFDEGKIGIPTNGSAAERTDFAARLTALAANATYIASITTLTQPSS